MTQPPSNSSVTVSGGTFNGPAAFGQDARATQHIHGDYTVNPEVKAELDRLRALIDEHRAQLSEANVVDGDFRVISDQVALPPEHRNRDRVLAALNRIGLHAAEVAAILTSIDQIRQLVL